MDWLPAKRMLYPRSVSWWPFLSEFYSLGEGTWCCRLLLLLLSARLKVDAYRKGCCRLKLKKETEISTHCIIEIFFWQNKSISAIHCYWLKFKFLPQCASLVWSKSGKWESITLKCCNLNVNEAIDKDADGIQIPRGNVSSLHGHGKSSYTKHIAIACKLDLKHMGPFSTRIRFSLNYKQGKA